MQRQEGERAQILAQIQFPLRLTLAIIPSITALVPKVQSHGQAPRGGLASCHHLAPLSKTHPPVGTYVTVTSPTPSPHLIFSASRAAIRSPRQGLGLGLPLLLPSHTQCRMWSPRSLVLPPLPPLWGPQRHCEHVLWSHIPAFRSRLLHLLRAWP